jgi:23S rRNA G2445 N2-methylase RlmL
LIARTVRGVEWIAADEIAGLSTSGLDLRAREIRFRLPVPDPRLLRLRTVDDVFLQVGTVRKVGHTKDVVPWLAERVVAQDWRGALATVRALRELPSAPRFDVVVSIVGRRNFNRYTVEDTVGAALAGTLGGRFVSRSTQAERPAEVDLTVRLFLEGPIATAALRLGRAPMHRRPYKRGAERGTLHPPLAAALARLAGPVDGETALDPFCGDGTIPIELALLCPGVRVAASDHDPARVRNTVDNAAAAGVPPLAVRADAGRQPWRSDAADLVVCNPPWNLTVDAAGLLTRSLDSFWTELDRVLAPRGRAVLVADAEMGVPGRLRDRGHRVALVQQIRLAGRLSDLLLCAPPSRPRPVVPAGLAEWRERAVAAGVVVGEGF